MRQQISLGKGAFLGGLTSLPVIALLYLANQLANLPFVPFDLFDWLARVLPGNVITAGIDIMVRGITLLGVGPTDRVAKLAEQGMGLALVIIGGIVLGAALAWILNRTEWTGARVGVIAGFLLFLTVAAIEQTNISAGNIGLALLWLLIVYIGWGALLGFFLDRRPAAVTPPANGAPIHRRAALGQIAAGSIAVALAAWGAGRALAAQRRNSGAGQPLSNAPAPTPALATQTTAPQRLEPAPGTRPEVTPNEQFYRIDIDTLPPTVNGPSWVLEVAGLFDKPSPLTLADFMKLPAVRQPITQGCISNPVGGSLISTTVWTGVRLRDLLKELGIRPSAQALDIKAADGFYESVSMADMLDERTLLVYGMNGVTLPVEHGFPLRIYIPNRYGMKQPKWITGIAAVAQAGPGYWVDRGWDQAARPQIVSVIDTVAKNAATADNKIPIGGIAWAGDRGIQKVEVQVDNGPWVIAALRTPPLSGLTWVQWRYDWPRQDGQHTFRVRATDGKGALQIEQAQDTYPSGATGYHAVTVTI